jgi:toxin YoeB
MANKKVQNQRLARTFVIAWAERAWEEYLYWQGHDQEIVKLINSMVEECRQHPFTGSAQPERLSHDFIGLWSRRITREHRLVYLTEGDTVYIFSCRHHY